MPNPNTLTVGTVSNTDVDVDMTLLDIGETESITLTADYSMLTPPGYPVRPSMTGAEPGRSGGARTIASGTTLTLMKPEADALTAAMGGGGGSWSVVTTGAENTSGTWMAFGFFDNKWIIVTHDGVSTSGTIVSTDGSTWTYHAGTIANVIASDELTFGGTSNLFLIVAQDPSTLAFTPWTSPDGVAWTQRSFASWTAGELPQIGGNASGFVALSAGSGHYETSPDGITWTAQNAYDSGGKVFLCNPFWDGSQWVSSVWKTPIVLITSPDGIHWTESGIPNSMSWLSTVAYDGSSRYVIAGTNDDNGAYGSPGSWTGVNLNQGGGAIDAGLSYGGGRFVSGCSNGTVSHSADGGVTWVRDAVPGDISGPFAFAYGQGHMMLACSDVNMLLVMS
jgi:hypothetical protein